MAEIQSIEGSGQAALWIGFASMVRRTVRPPIPFKSYPCWRILFDLFSLFFRSISLARPTTRIQRLPVSFKLQHVLYHFLTAIITLIASLAYLLMALMTAGVTPLGTEVIWVHYLDWIVTTPMLLLDLGMLAGMRLPEVIFLAFCDALMVAAGYAGVISDDPRAVWPFFAFSCYMFVIIFVRLLMKMRELSSKEPDTAESKAFRFLALWTAGLWTFYPVLFVMVKTGLLFRNNEIIVYCILDIFAKGLFGAVLVGSREVLEGEHTLLATAVMRLIGVNPLLRRNSGLSPDIQAAIQEYLKANNGGRRTSNRWLSGRHLNADVTVPAVNAEPTQAPHGRRDSGAALIGDGYIGTTGDDYLAGLSGAPYGVRQAAGSPAGAAPFGNPFAGPVSPKGPSMRVHAATAAAGGATAHRASPGSAGAPTDLAALMTLQGLLAQQAGKGAPLDPALAAQVQALTAAMTGAATQQRQHQTAPPAVSAPPQPAVSTSATTAGGMRQQLSTALALPSTLKQRGGGGSSARSVPGTADHVDVNVCTLDDDAVSHV